jgi:L-rhamnose mutarotase
MSPYENRLNSEDFRRIALVAEVAPDQFSELESKLAAMPADLSEQVAKVGIGHLHVYLQCFDSRSLLFIYFEMSESDQEKAAQLLKQSSNWWSEIEPLLKAHPRASVQNAPWQRAEFMNVVSTNTARQREIGQPIGLAAGLHPDKELWYRTLHQTNWPGVTDQMKRSHYQNWTTFMLEFEQELMLFTHFEYLGKDKAADDAITQADPVTNRWWTHTEPCLYTLVKGQGNWVEMNHYS